MNNDRDTARVLIVKSHQECPLREDLVIVNVFSRCKQTGIECHTIHAFPEDCPLHYAPELRQTPLPKEIEKAMTTIAEAEPKGTPSGFGLHFERAETFRAALIVIRTALSKPATLDGAFTFVPDRQQTNPRWVSGEIMCGHLKIADISLIQGQPGMAEENIGHLLTNANIVQSFRGCVGYLKSLPKNVRPDDTWFKPAEEALARLEGK